MFQPAALEIRYAGEKGRQLALGCREEKLTVSVNGFAAMGSSPSGALIHP